MEKGKEYLMFKVEGKSIPVDLKYLKSEDFVLQIGYVDKDKFTAEKSLSLEDLEKMGFKLE